MQLVPNQNWNKNVGLCHFEYLRHEIRFNTDVKALLRFIIFMYCIIYLYLFHIILYLYVYVFGTSRIVSSKCEESKTRFL
jgi:hypothetical protein